MICIVLYIEEPPCGYCAMYYGYGVPKARFYRDSPALVTPHIVNDHLSPMCASAPEVVYVCALFPYSPTDGISGNKGAV